MIGCIKNKTKKIKEGYGKFNKKVYEFKAVSLLPRISFKIGQDILDNVIVY